MTCCATCNGKGWVGWISLYEFANDDNGEYAKSIECPDCKGSGGWDQKPTHRMTLNDLRAENGQIH